LLELWKILNVWQKRVIDLHGKDSAEAVFVLENSIARYYKEGIAVIEIIHGKGTGVLREVVRKSVRSEFVRKYLSRVEIGEQGTNNGGSGVTTVYLKSREKTKQAYQLKNIQLVKDLAVVEDEEAKAQFKLKKDKGKQRYIKRMKRMDKS
jgi:hypothetical protein